jgi:hypothetical protein
MCLISGPPDDPEDDIVMETYGVKALYSAVKRLIHAIWTPQLLLEYH